MTIIRYTLMKIYDKWEDPGDYPSNAGGSKKQAFLYLASIPGDVEILYEQPIKKMFLDGYTLADIAEFVSNDFYLCYKHAPCHTFTPYSVCKEDPPVNFVLDGIRFNSYEQVSVVGHFEIMSNV